MALKDCINCEIDCPFKEQRQCPKEKENCILWQIYKIGYEGNALTLMAMKVILERGNQQEALTKITRFLSEHGI